MKKDIFKKGQKATLIAGSTTLFFALAKGVVGLISGSTILLADAVHSGADAFSTATAWFGLKIAKKEPTEKFRYGFYKVENIATLLISILIFFAGATIMTQSVERFSTKYEIHIPFIAISLAILDAIFMFIVGTYEMKKGKEINSQSLIADGKESRLHIYSSSLVLVGLVSSYLNFLYIEGIFGILISFIIFKTGFESARDSIFALLDVSPSKEIEKKVRLILEENSNLEDFRDLKLRRSGPFVLGEVKVKVKKKLSVQGAHEISATIEAKIKRSVKQIDSFLISVEPYKSNVFKICIPIKDDKGMDSEISNHFGRTNNFLFLLIERGKTKEYTVKKNPFKNKEIRAGLNIAEQIMKENIDIIITKQIGPISLHTLGDDLIEVYQTKQNKVGEAVESFIQGKLEELKSPTRKKK